MMNPACDRFCEGIRMEVVALKEIGGEEDVVMNVVS
jgi:hypothetical protein